MDKKTLRRIIEEEVVSRVLKKGLSEKELLISIASGKDIETIINKYGFF